ncbi:winged helix DNA-binding domain-containing protein [Agilicoccus flavus]|uniref:winged helix DNA-binding domain-containing protein n=1 Tax=Agilicoccus flavus TaxID=2775968 RepID=UPI001CF6CA95|nr:winged helix DNA-binding domain-containing protein [Agilicoccus flavus]
MDYTWDDLAGLALARQFPQVDGHESQSVDGLLRRIGPIQSQTARSPYLALAARLPGVDLETIGAAYECHAIVRGSTIRGTVHTSTPQDHALLEALTRLGQRTLWARTMRLVDRSLEELWAGIEDFAAPAWRTPAELAEHLRSWIAAHDPSAIPNLENDAGRYFAFGHGGLLRRPLSGGWQAQGAPGYRTAAVVLGDADERGALLADRAAALDRAVRRHLSAHGPASRHDLAWWSGVGLRPVDAALARLAPDLREGTGPDGRVYHDLVAGQPAPVDLPGVRLLPEFDALLCAYDPPARERFVDAAHYRRLWTQANGMILAPLLVDGRMTGWWRLPGSGSRRLLEVSWFARTRRPRKAEFDAPTAHLEAAYGVTVTDLTLTRE